jgi:hypothetical protein
VLGISNRIINTQKITSDAIFHGLLAKYFLMRSFIASPQTLSCTRLIKIGVAGEGHNDLLIIEDKNSIYSDLYSLPIIV